MSLSTPSLVQYTACWRKKVTDSRERVTDQFRPSIKPAARYFEDPQSICYPLPSFNFTLYNLEQHSGAVYDAIYRFQKEDVLAKLNIAIKVFFTFIKFYLFPLFIFSFGM
jgi:hypothetical protein